jgi:hypothetical protein
MDKLLSVAAEPADLGASDLYPRMNLAYSMLCAFFWLYSYLFAALSQALAQCQHSSADLRNIIIITDGLVCSLLPRAKEDSILLIFYF